MKALTRIDIPDRAPDYRGKVRDIYDLGNELLIVATDRLSAFDVVFEQGIPGKGRLLTEISNKWFSLIDFAPNHLLATDPKDFPAPFRDQAEQLAGRAVLVRKARRVDFECVVRGYLAGSGWREYRESGTVCGHPLPAGLAESEVLPEPIFTPATKADSGHDENVPFSYMVEKLGSDLAEKLKSISLDLYRMGRERLAAENIILADTKFEFGLDPDSGEILIIDEVLTPDSSRFWPREEYRTGISPPSYDKQIVRDYLQTLDWDKNPPAPRLPEEILEKTRAQYQKLKDIICSW